MFTARQSAHLQPYRGHCSIVVIKLLVNQSRMNVFTHAYTHPHTHVITARQSARLQPYRGLASVSRASAHNHTHTHTHTHIHTCSWPGSQRIDSHIEVVISHC